jgi:hypothetical protein
VDAKQKLEKASAKSCGGVSTTPRGRGGGGGAEHGTSDSTSDAMRPLDSLSAPDESRPLRAAADRIYKESRCADKNSSTGTVTI